MTTLILHTFMQPNHLSSTTLPTFSTNAPCQYHRGHALSVSQLSLSHEGHVLFHAADLSLPHGSITGLVGSNGSGKSSLAKVLASKLLDGFPQTLTVEYLAAADDEDGHSNEGGAGAFQNSESSLKKKPHEYIQSRIKARLDILNKEIERLELVMEEDDTSQEHLEETADTLSCLYDLEESIRAKMESETEHSMEVVGLKPHAHKTLEKLSCGWRYKCRLVAALLAHPDLLIIDEPSFLDTYSTEWFVEQLQRLARDDNVVVLLISHKETLLDTLCDRIMYINSAASTLSTYACSYQKFRETLEAEIQLASKTIEETQDKFESAEKSLKHVQKQLQKREKNFNKACSESAIDKRFIKGKNKEAKQKADRSAASKLKKAQRSVEDSLELKRKAQRERVKPLRIDGFPATGTIVSLQDVGVTFVDDAEFVFQHVDTSLEANDRVLLRGQNGCGKSTLIKLILGEIEPNEGSVSRVTNNILYFPQTALHELLSEHGQKTALEFLDQTMTETQARQHLGNLGLSKDLALQSVSTLSAGQRVRLWVAKQLLLHPKPALLILDEMSENIDVETRKSLIDMLKNFDGGVLVVSHDPDFCESFDFTKTWMLYPNGLHVQFPD